MSVSDLLRSHHRPQGQTCASLRLMLNQPAHPKPQPAKTKVLIATQPCPWVQGGPGRCKSQTKEQRSFPLESARDFDILGVVGGIPEIFQILLGLKLDFLFPPSTGKREVEVKHRDILHHPKKDNQRDTNIKPTNSRFWSRYRWSKIDWDFLMGEKDPSYH